jgi:hypothetical protein
MNGNAGLLLLFVILLLGLILCSFLGGSGCKEGMENNTNSQVFTGPNGTSAQIQTGSNGQNTLVITSSSGTKTTYTSSSTSSTTYTGPNGTTATVHNNSSGVAIIQVKDKQGNDILTLTNNSNTGTSTITTQNATYVKSNSTSNSNSNSNYDNYDHYNQASYPVIFYGPNGGTARVIKTDNNNTIVITSSNGATQIYYIDKNSGNPDFQAYYGPNGGSAKVVTDSQGKKAVEVTTPDGTKILYYSDNIYVQNSQDSSINQYSADSNTTGSDYNNAFTASTYYGPYGGQVNTVTGPAGNTYATYDNSGYYNSLPQGISKNQIPPGQEDLYILKSEVVPPVCPACPQPIMQCPENSDVTKCPPCPPCARCPEPAFDCKKVPNYGAFNQDFMPVPVMNDFSSFGM